MERQSSRALVWHGALALLAVACWTHLAAFEAHAQRDRTAFRGTVVDQEGRPLEGTTIRMTELSRGVARDTETNDEGEFRLRGLRPGAYEVVVEKESYRGVQETVQLRLGTPLRREYRLVVAVLPVEEAFRRGVEAFTAGNFEEAARAFEEAVDLAPDVVDTHTNLAAAYARLGRDEDALRELQTVTELAPDSFDAAAQLGATYAQLNRFDEAIETYEAALAKEHDAAASSVHDAWMNLGTLYFMAERTRDALDAYENALGSHPGSARALLAIGKCHFNLGETDEAMASFRQVVDVAPASSEASEAEGYLEALEKAREPGGAR